MAISIFSYVPFFPSHYERMAFVAENGANILIGRKHIYNAEIPSENIKKTLAILEKLQPKNLILCGKKALIFLKRYQTPR